MCVAVVVVVVIVVAEIVVVSTPYPTCQRDLVTDKCPCFPFTHVGEFLFRRHVHEVSVDISQHSKDTCLDESE